MVSVCDKLELHLFPTLFVEVSSHSSLPIHTQCMGALRRFEICQFCTDYRIGPWSCILITEGSITPYPDASALEQSTFERQGLGLRFHPLMHHQAPRI